MNTPVTPNPASARKAHEERLRVEAAMAESTDRLIQAIEQKYESTAAPKTSPERKRAENRKRAQQLKKQKMSNKEIAETMHLPESTILQLLKPYEPKPHLTQRIEGLDQVKTQINKSQHPAGRGKRNGGK